MIPNVAGAALVGLLWLWANALLVAALVTWWGWRLWQAQRGRPRPPLCALQWGLVVVLLILPIGTALSWLQLWWQDQRAQAVALQEEVWGL